MHIARNLMASELMEAAQSGNVDHLLKLVQDNPNILRAVELEGGETPLHVACISGHLEFVKEMMKLRPEFARELSNGFTPLHIAAVIGDVEIVKELAKAENSQLCVIVGRDGKIPLHFAVIKGRNDVVKELLSANSDSVEAVTAKGETALHLAVNNHQFRTLNCLLEHLNKSKKVDVVNRQDHEGNTILHLAVSLKQFEVVDLMVNKYKEDVDINSLNKKRMTALDVVSMFPSEAWDREMEEKLLKIGAENSSNEQTAESESESSEQELSAAELTEMFKFKKNRDKPSEVRNALLVIATLIVTATYQSVVNPPGGLWQDTIDDGPNKPHQAGFSILLSRNEIVYGFFLVLNSVGFFGSICILIVLTAGFPLANILGSATGSLAVSYCFAMVTFVPKRVAPILFVVCSMLPFGIVSIYLGVMDHLDAFTYDRDTPFFNFILSSLLRDFKDVFRRFRRLF